MRWVVLVVMLVASPVWAQVQFPSAKIGNADVALFIGQYPCVVLVSWLEEGYDREAVDMTPRGASAYAYLVGFANGRNVVTRDELARVYLSTKLICARDPDQPAVNVLLEATARF